MAISIPPLTNNFISLKSAIEKIAREAQSLQAVSGQEDRVYVDSVPSLANTKEGQFVLYFDGANYRIYTKINNQIKYWVLT